MGGKNGPGPNTPSKRSKSILTHRHAISGYYTARTGICSHFSPSGAPKKTLPEITGHTGHRELTLKTDDAKIGDIILKAFLITPRLF